MSTMTSKEARFMKRYFKVTAAIWSEWKENRDNPKFGGMSMIKRDKLLAECRVILAKAQGTLSHKTGV